MRVRISPWAPTDGPIAEKPGRPIECGVRRRTRSRAIHRDRCAPPDAQRVTVTAQFCESDPTVTVTVAVPAPTAVIWICEPWPCATVATDVFEDVACACWVRSARVPSL